MQGNTLTISKIPAIVCPKFNKYTMPDTLGIAPLGDSQNKF
jgi:hypothetical protein